MARATVQKQVVAPKVVAPAPVPGKPRQPAALVRISDGEIFPYNPILARDKGFRPLANLPTSHVNQIKEAQRRDAANAAMVAAVAEQFTLDTEAARKRRKAEATAAIETNMANVAADESLVSGVDIDNADAATISEYVKSTYNIDLDPEMGLEEIRAEARSLEGLIG